MHGSVNVWLAVALGFSATALGACGGGKVYDDDDSSSADKRGSGGSTGAQGGTTSSSGGKEAQCSIQVASGSHTECDYELCAGYDDPSVCCDDVTDYRNVAGTTCGGSCVDLQSNSAHCGACDASCATGEACNSGTCQKMVSAETGGSGAGGNSAVGGASSGSASAAGGTGAGGTRHEWDLERWQGRQLSDGDWWLGRRQRRRLGERRSGRRRRDEQRRKGRYRRHGQRCRRHE